LKKLLIITVILLLLPGCSAYRSTKAIYSKEQYRPIKTRRPVCHRIHDRNILYRGTLTDLRYLGAATLYPGLYFAHGGGEAWEIPLYPFYLVGGHIETALTFTAETLMTPVFAYTKIECLDYDPEKEKEELAAIRKRRREEYEKKHPPVKMMKLHLRTEDSVIH